jgi:hypothetical protein
MFVKVIELDVHSDRYTNLSGGIALSQSYSLREAVLNTEKIIKIDATCKYSIEDVKKFYPELRDEASISCIMFQEGQHTREMYVIGNIDLLLEKFNGKMILKG